MVSYLSARSSNRFLVKGSAKLAMLRTRAACSLKYRQSNAARRALRLRRPAGRCPAADPDELPPWPFRGHADPRDPSPTRALRIRGWRRLPAAPILPSLAASEWPVAYPWSSASNSFLFTRRRIPQSRHCSEMLTRGRVSKLSELHLPPVPLRSGKPAPGRHGSE